MRVFTVASIWSLVNVVTAQNPFSGPNGRCPSIQLFLVEAQGSSNLLGVAVAILDIAAGVNITSLPYAPSSDLSSSIEEGFISTTIAIQDFSKKCPDGKIVLLGDAQGASYISATLAGTDVSGRPIPASIISDQVTAVVLYRDATQAAGQGQQAACPACSTGGPFARTSTNFDVLQSFADRLQNWCSANDASCCSSGNAQVPAGSYFTETNRAYAINLISEKLGVASSFGPESFPSSCTLAPPAPQTSNVQTSAPTTSLTVTSEVPTTTVAAPTTTVAVPATTSAKTVPIPATYSTQQAGPKTTSPSAATQSNAKASSASSASSLPSPAPAQYSPAPGKDQGVPEVSRGAGERLAPSAILALVASGIVGSIMTLIM